jgi:hypothetical protein
MEITTVGLDLAKSIFQVHAVDAAGICGRAARLRGRKFDRLATPQSRCCHSNYDGHVRAKAALVSRDTT